MKTKEELNALKDEFEILNKKINELTEDELRLVVGGSEIKYNMDDGYEEKEIHIYENELNKDFNPGFPTGSDK